MTFIPQPPFGTGAPVNATTDTTNANFGATNFPHSPNFSSGKTSTQGYEAKLNVLNVGTKPPTP
jgi:hypothetical protein